MIVMFYHGQSSYDLITCLIFLLFTRKLKWGQQESWSLLMKMWIYWRKNCWKKRAVERGQSQRYPNYKNSTKAWRSWRMSWHLGSWWLKTFPACHVVMIYLWSLELYKSMWIAWCQYFKPVFQDMLEEQIFLLLIINYTLKNIKVCSFLLHLEGVEGKKKSGQAGSHIPFIFIFEFFLNG